MDEAPDRSPRSLPLPPPLAGPPPDPGFDPLFDPARQPPRASAGAQWTRHQRQVRPGELTPGWRVAVIAAWVGIIVGLMAVWRSSWMTGLPTWWLGPQAASRSWLIISVPFIAPAVMVTLAAVGARHVWAYGLAASLILSQVAWGDVGRVNGYALIEFALAAAGLLISAASYGGMARRAE